MTTRPLPSRFLRSAAFLCFWTVLASAQSTTPLTGSAELQETLDRLNTLGSVLILGAHPDDENTAVIAYFARARHYRTAYLSATRGEGGQNLIGPEQGALMGVIRTQELLAARRIDGGEQFFTRAIDFGYSKSAGEALAKWGRERVLSDMVRVIRRFRPDVLITRFSPERRGGHGHHSAVGLLAPEAYKAAANPNRFPEHRKQDLDPWKPRRLYWNTRSFTRQLEAREAQRKDRLRINTGQYDPVLGKSYAEIAGESRSMHRSQAMGASQRKGPVPAFFAYLAGDRVENDLFEGIDKTWSRVPGAARVGRLLKEARGRYRPQDPVAILPLLVEAYSELIQLDHPWATFKEADLLRAIELAAGLWMDASAGDWHASPGTQADITLSALNRSTFAFTWTRTKISGATSQQTAKPLELSYNRPTQQDLAVTIPEDAPYSQPYAMQESPDGASYSIEDPKLIGLPESPPVLQATFYLKTSDGVELPFRKPVIHRWVDRSLGERTRRFEIVPAVAVNFAQPNRIFPDASPRKVTVRLENHLARATGKASLRTPSGWSAEPSRPAFEATRPGQQITLEFDLNPPQASSGGSAVAEIHLDGKTVSTGIQTLEYPHIPIQVVCPRAEMSVERADVKLLSNDIGYIMGAGDRVPEALEQMGASVTLLSDRDLSSADLSRFDAIVTGVRAVNTRAALHAARERVLDYVRQGGTLVVQYNTTRGGPGSTRVLAPYPMEPSRHRVSVEDALVTILQPEHPLLQKPNRITKKDFEGWVQERGLYFMSDWDRRYDAILASHDPGEPPRKGGLLYTRYGKGVYIFTGYSWFRQLPAGVPGAYRIFANLLSAGKTAPQP